MKKSLLALAALTAFAGAASAQSSVTLFGIVDAGVARISAGGKSVTGMTNSGYNSSRLGFRGVEDLGGGLRAEFWIEGQLFNDSGDGRNTGTALDFQRRSTVALAGNFGEIRLGPRLHPDLLEPDRLRSVRHQRHRSGHDDRRDRRERLGDQHGYRRALE
ncbi:MAG: porin [Rubrivivax sp.]